MKLSKRCKSITAIIKVKIKNSFVVRIAAGTLFPRNDGKTTKYISVIKPSLRALKRRSNLDNKTVVYVSFPDCRVRELRSLPRNDGKTTKGEKIMSLLDFLGFGGSGTVQAISPQQAKSMMDEGKPYILLDVRTPQEYSHTRISGAKSLPVDEINSRAQAELPDKEIPILIYCQSGMRAGRASKMLAGMGYAKVFNFGGIMDWPYKTIKG